MAPASTTLLKPLLTSVLFFLLFTHAPTCNAQCRTQSILYSKETLKAGERLIEGPYRFVMQQNCNLVLYDNNKTVWASNTAGSATNCQVTMQPDCNLVMHGHGRFIWASNTWKRGEADYALILRKDGNVVIYGGDAIRVAKNGVMMYEVRVNAIDETNNGTTNLIKTVV